MQGGVWVRVDRITHGRCDHVRGKPYTQDLDRIFAFHMVSHGYGFSHDALCD